MYSIIEKYNQTFDYEKLLDEYYKLYDKLGFIDPKDNPVARHRTTIFYKEEPLPGVKELAPYTIEVCNFLRENSFRFNYACFRLMPPHTTLSWHRDAYVSTNHHIPIKTNEGCFYACDGHLFNMQNVGYLYRVDSTRPHTFINAGAEARIHAHFVTDLNGHLMREESA